MWRAALGLVAVGCAAPAEGPHITIGGILAITGTVAGVGSDMLRGAQLAVQDVNDAGGVLGKPLVLENVDDHSDPVEAEEAAARLVDAKVGAIVGNVRNNLTQATATVAIAAEIVVSAPCAPKPSIRNELPEELPDGYLFRSCPSDAYQAALIAERVRSSGYERLAIVHEPDSYGPGLSMAVDQNFTGQGGTVTGVHPYENAQASYVDLLTTVFDHSPEEQPEALLLAGSPADSATFIRDYLANFQDHPVLFLFPHPLRTDDFVNGVGGRNFTFPHEGTAPTLGDLASPQFQAYADRYRRDYGSDPGQFVGNAYDATMVVALAMVAGRSTDGPDIAANLHAVASGGEVVGAEDVRGMLDAAAGGDDIDYQGVTGDMDFDEAGDVLGNYDIWSVDEKGRIVTIESVPPPDLPTAP